MISANNTLSSKHRLHRRRLIIFDFCASSVYRNVRTEIPNVRTRNRKQEALAISVQLFGSVGCCKPNKKQHIPMLFCWIKLLIVYRFVFLVY